MKQTLHDTSFDGKRMKGSESATNDASWTVLAPDRATGLNDLAVKRAEDTPMERSELRTLIERSLQRQGFLLENGRLCLPAGLDKQAIRNLHSEAVKHKIDRSADGLRKHESRLLGYIASGSEVDPSLISPRLVEVLPDSEEELLFRYISLHWSIPVSSGYGRRLRFLVVDDENEKLIGLIGLGDPVFALGPRDRWIGWSRSDRQERLRWVMDAFVLGAVPPYSRLLCGKLVAMLVTSDEVRAAFARKYASSTSLISKRPVNGTLAMVATSSALGRSSIYNRLSFEQRLLFQPVGYTEGSGDFHFANGIYKQIKTYGDAHCVPTAKKSSWGTGFRNRREIVRKVLSHLGLSGEWQYHGVRRQVFVVPLARNTREFLSGSDSSLDFPVQPASALFCAFRDRWLIPRLRWDDSYREFDASSYAIWTAPGRSEFPGIQDEKLGTDL